MHSSLLDGPGSGPSVDPLLDETSAMSLCPSPPQGAIYPRQGRCYAPERPVTLSKGPFTLDRGYTDACYTELGFFQGVPSNLENRKENFRLMIVKLNKLVENNLSQC